tara:strand:- start:1098 stop:1934 length:837 start_codon:yes stop_codon:yes gene_type:complete
MLKLIDLILEEANPDAPEGGGGGGLPIAPSSEPVEAPPVDEPVAAEPTPTEPTPVAEPVAPAAAPLSADSIAEAFARQQQQNQPVAPVTPPTQDQINEATRRWKPAANFMSQLMGGEDGNDLAAQQSALDGMQDGLATHILTIANQLIEQRLGAVNEQLAPLQEYVASATGQKTEETFFTSFPALKEHRDTAVLVAQSMGGQQFTDAKSKMQAIASATEAVIKRANPNFTLTATQPTKTPQTSTMPATQIPGGQGGAGGSPATNALQSAQQRAVSALR